MTDVAVDQESTVPQPAPTVEPDDLPPVWVDLPSAQPMPARNGRSTPAVLAAAGAYSAQGSATLTGIGSIYAVIPGDTTSWNTGITTQTAYFTGNAWIQTSSSSKRATIRHTDELTCTGVSVNASVSLGGVELSSGWQSATGSRTETATDAWVHYWEYNGSGQWKCKVTAYLPAKATRRTYGTVSTKSASSTVSASYEWWFCC